MKPDLYTKAVLTVIALMLAVIACKTVITPETTASAQGRLAGVQVSGAAQFGVWAFDTGSGELWFYSRTDRPVSLGKMSKIGAPLVK